ncbi:MAG: phosphoribosylaminoimidazolesuccinocarboxamide synthase [Deltaproteobacteria bacterium]|nr:phosphoribosylaminoimidazolesuccinocarboxamide synthase [Deltaproteobacteria bacterium]MBW2447694.1 phosphoribosylaminoimidazolesuccinocarboxamide synthase [Deltaproteobacteria bacterium]
MDVKLLEEQCSRTLERTDLQGLGQRIEGKVRDSYVDGPRRTIVVSDRVSCFDVVVGTIPFKGQVLNQVAAFWFDKTKDIARNHLIDVPDPNVSVVEECEILPIEFVYRGYLTGVSNTSIWTAYERGEREYCGHTLPDGMTKHQPLPEAMLTPTTKAEHGAHDELTSRAAIIESGVVSEELYDRAAALTGKMFAEGQRFAATRGLILVDTKYEIGLDADGELVVADEIHTPDSSRYWYRDVYEQAMSKAQDPPALDKEYVRSWLADQGYRGDGEQPELTLAVRCEAARRYIEAYERVTGLSFEPDLDPPAERVPRNLGL